MRDPSRRDVLQGAAAVAGGAGASTRARTTSAGPALPAAPELPGSLTVKGTRFMKDGKPFFISGFNYWAGPTLARDGNQAGLGSGAARSRRPPGRRHQHDPDLRATEGPDTEPSGSCRRSSRRWASTIRRASAGVDALRRGDRRSAASTRSSCSTTSGSGRAASRSTCPGPARGRSRIRRPTPGGNWDRFQNFSAASTRTRRRSRRYDALINFLVPKLAGNPMIIWELANEPRGMNNVGAYRKWIDATARLIKSLAPSQLVPPAAKGRRRRPCYAGLERRRGSHERRRSTSSASTCGPRTGTGSTRRTSRRATRRRSSARRSTSTSTPSAAAKVGKPILLEEFGFPRDGGSFDPASPLTLRDQYFQEVYALVHALHADDADGRDHALGVGGRQPPAASGRVLEAGRSVHRRSAARGAGLVQHLRQGHDAEADHRVVAPDHRDRP